MADLFDETPTDEISMRAALYKMPHFFGMEPLLGQMLIAVAVLMVFIWQKQLSVVLGGLLLVFDIPWLRARGKYDLHYTTVLIRSLIAQPYYPPRSYVNVKRAAIRPQQRIKRS